ncbi:MAG: adenylyl-sulfate kinase [Candidatus Omnitrophica bacterium]|nr:adenylyl-sulfate kinase [Candidatus Omnitrophota bacterium]
MSEIPASDYKDLRTLLAGEKQKGVVIWLTGFSGAGKSTVAEKLSTIMTENGNKTYILDGDKIRTGLCSDLGFSPEDRTENIRRIGEVAKLFSNTGIITIVAFISPYRSDRDRVRTILKTGEFIEVFVDCPIEECERRDPKGLYKRARAGEIPQFTGISAPYEPPAKPEIHLRTKEHTVEECAHSIIEYLKQKRIVGGV